jgi:hypothetical protein
MSVATCSMRRNGVTIMNDSKRAITSSSTYVVMAGLIKLNSNNIVINIWLLTGLDVGCRLQLLNCALLGENLSHQDISVCSGAIQRDHVFWCSGTDWCMISSSTHWGQRRFRSASASWVAFYHFFSSSLIQSITESAVLTVSGMVFYVAAAVVS